MRFDLRNPVSAHLLLAPALIVALSISTQIASKTLYTSPFEVIRLTLAMGLAVLLVWMRRQPNFVELNDSSITVTRTGRSMSFPYTEIAMTRVKTTHQIEIRLHHKIEIMRWPVKRGTNRIRFKPSDNVAPLVNLLESHLVGLGTTVQRD